MKIAVMPSPLITTLNSSSKSRFSVSTAESNTSVTMSGFEKLDDALTIAILVFLSTDELIIVTLVNKRLLHMVDNPKHKSCLWSYHLSNYNQDKIMNTLDVNSPYVWNKSTSTFAKERIVTVFKDRFLDANGAPNRPKKGGRSEYIDVLNDLQYDIANHYKNILLEQIKEEKKEMQKKEESCKGMWFLCCIFPLVEVLTVLVVLNADKIIGLEWYEVLVFSPIISGLAGCWLLVGFRYAKNKTQWKYFIDYRHLENFIYWGDWTLFTLLFLLKILGKIDWSYIVIFLPHIIGNAICIFSLLVRLIAINLETRIPNAEYVARLLGKDETLPLSELSIVSKGKILWSQTTIVGIINRACNLVLWLNIANKANQAPISWTETFIPYGVIIFVDICLLAYVKYLDVKDDGPVRITKSFCIFFLLVELFVALVISLIILRLDEEITNPWVIIVIPVWFVMCLCVSIPILICIAVIKSVMV